MSRYLGKMVPPFPRGIQVTYTEVSEAMDAKIEQRKVKGRSEDQSEDFR